MMDSYLGPDLSGAVRIRKSPLYAIDEGFKATLDRTTENLYIKTTWHRALPHLRLSIGHRHWLDTTFRFSIITDERIKNVFVGNESYKQRSAKVRDDRDNFNGLKDLVEGYDLLIIRLGFLGYKNVAAPGALREALMLREVARKPTWIVQNTDDPPPKAWDEEVSAYISEHFGIVDLSRLPTGPEGPEPPAPLQVEEHEPAPQRQARKSEFVSTNEDDPLSMMSVGNKKPESRYKTTFKKKRPGHNDGGGNEGGFGGMNV